MRAWMITLAGAVGGLGAAVGVLLVAFLVLLLMMLSRISAQLEKKNG